MDKELHSSGSDSNTMDISMHPNSKRASPQAGQHGHLAGAYDAMIMKLNGKVDA